MLKHLKQKILIISIPMESALKKPLQANDWSSNIGYIF